MEESRLQDHIKYGFWDQSPVCLAIWTLCVGGLNTGVSASRAQVLLFSDDCAITMPSLAQDGVIACLRLQEYA